MCVVSMVMDSWRPYIPYVPVAPQPFISPWTPQQLQELIDSFKAAVKAAETLDRLTGQPDCVDPEKATLVERVAELERRLGI